MVVAGSFLIILLKLIKGTCVNFLGSVDFFTGSVQVSVLFHELHLNRKPDEIIMIL